MQISLRIEELQVYVKNQLGNFYPDCYNFEGNDVNSAMNLALDRLEYCFKHINFRGYNKNGIPNFSHLHSDQYSTFLYFLSNSLWKISENKVLCDKLILLNRALHGIWFSYKGKLPDIFFLMHPIGTVLGNANYNNFLVVYQNVTVNSNFDENGNIAPKIGEQVVLGTGTSILGNKDIGNNVSITDVPIFNQYIPDNSIVFRNSEGKVEVRNNEKKNKVLRSFFIDRYL